MYRCQACVYDYPMKADMTTEVDLQPSAFGKKLGINSKEAMATIISELARNISASKERLLDKPVQSADGEGNY